MFLNILRITVFLNLKIENLKQSLNRIKNVSIDALCSINKPMNGQITGRYVPPSPDGATEALTQRMNLMTGIYCPSDKPRPTSRDYVAV